jgi:hypothetical protein
MPDNFMFAYYWRLQKINNKMRRNRYQLMEKKEQETKIL